MEGVNFILFIFRLLAYVLVIGDVIVAVVDFSINRIVNRNSKGHEDDDRS